MELASYDYVKVYPISPLGVNLAHYSNPPPPPPPPQYLSVENKFVTYHFVEHCISAHKNVVK